MTIHGQVNGSGASHRLARLDGPRRSIDRLATRWSGPPGRHLTPACLRRFSGAAAQRRHVPVAELGEVSREAHLVCRVRPHVAHVRGVVRMGLGRLPERHRLALARAWRTVSRSSGSPFVSTRSGCAGQAVQSQRTDPSGRRCGPGSACCRVLVVCANGAFSQHTEAVPGVRLIECCPPAIYRCTFSPPGIIPRPPSKHHHTIVSGRPKWILPRRPSEVTLIERVEAPLGDVAAHVRYAEGHSPASCPHVAHA